MSKDRCVERRLLGIDGGGTKTKLEIADQNGKTLKSLTVEGTNPFDIGVERSQLILKEAIFKVCDGFSLQHICLFAGLAGGASGNNKAIYADFFKKFNFAAFDNGSDIENIISAGLGDSDGIALIMGTGICAYRVIGGKKERIAGWGYLLDNGGSGYNIGRDALSAVFSEFDGSGEKTCLTELIKPYIDGNMNKWLEKIYIGGKRYIASFAPLVFSASEKGDKIATKIIESNIKQAAEVLTAAAKPFEKRVKVVVAGGLTKQSSLIKRLSEKLDETDKYNILVLETEPVKGAVRLAGNLNVAQ